MRAGPGLVEVGIGVGLIYAPRQRRRRRPCRPMFENHTIARIAGIPVRASLLLGYLLALWLIWGAANGRAGETLLLVVLATALLLAHELGHAIVARRFGLQVLDIILWPLGGMARIVDMPESPRKEGWVAAAGPLVNLALALVFLPFVFIGDPPVHEERELFGVPFGLPGGFQGAMALGVVINLAYGLFNLLPAFPMDGGRILRAFLARGGRSWTEATDRATRAGSLIAWGMILWALLSGRLLLVPIGFFVLWAGLRERWTVRLRHRAEAMSGAQGRFAGWEELLRRQGFPTPDPAPADEPVLDVDGGPVSGPRGTAPGGGFSEDDIKRLESFRGRLKRPEGEDGAAG